MWANIGNKILTQAPHVSWSGSVFRSHRPTFAGDDPTGSFLNTGRWNVGADKGGGQAPFPALYTSTAALIASWERLRHVERTATDMVKAGDLKTALTEMVVDLTTVLDLRGWEALSIPRAVFTEDDYDPGNDIASAAYLAGLAGLLVPTATGLGLRSGDFNVIIFYEQTAATRTVYGRVFPVLAVRAGCAIRVVATEIPALPGP